MTYLFGENITEKQLQTANVQIDHFGKMFVISRRLPDGGIPYVAPCHDFTDCQNFNSVVNKLLEGLPTDSVVFFTQACIKAVNQIAETAKKNTHWFTKAKF